MNTICDTSIYNILSYLKTNEYRDVCIEFNLIAKNKSAFIIQKNIKDWFQCSLKKYKTKLYILRYLPIKYRSWDFIEELMFLNENTISNLFQNSILSMESECLRIMIENGIDDTNYLDCFIGEYCFEVFTLSYDTKLKIIEYSNCNTNDNIANLFNFMIYNISTNRRFNRMGLVEFELDYISLNIINFNLRDILDFISKRIRYVFNKQGFTKSLHMIHKNVIKNIDDETFHNLF